MEPQDNLNTRPIEDKQNVCPPEVKEGWYINPVVTISEAQRQADAMVADYVTYQGSRS